MIDWHKGGWTGSLRRYARREVRAQLRSNPAARTSRYSLFRRAVRWLFRRSTFMRFIRHYLIIDLAFVMCEALVASFAPDALPNWAAPSATGTDIETLLLQASGYYIAAQAGALGVMTLALALVTLIAQRENSDMDIKLYYHESMAFQTVASSLALLTVLAAQLLWPLQFALHQFEFGTDNLIFKAFLLGLHLIWLLANLAAIAYFIDTTFRFVQPSARQFVRKRYTANIVQPSYVEQLLCQRLYTLAAYGSSDLPDDSASTEWSVAFGIDDGESYATEIEAHFSHSMALRDVRMAWINWVIRRWSVRSGSVTQQSAAPFPGIFSQEALLWFTPHINHPMRGSVGWCRRRGGVPLTTVEKFVLRHAFVFQRIDDGE